MRRLIATGVVLAIAGCASMPHSHRRVTGLPACTPAPLVAMIADVERRFGPVKVISSHRPGARIFGTGYPSLHASCRAIDFHPAKGQYTKVVDYLMRNWRGGIGTYSGRFHHIHIDDGTPKRFHKR